jgi:hypothetical protein
MTPPSPARTAVQRVGYALDWFSVLRQMSAGQVKEAQQEVGVSLVADLQSPVAYQPRQRPLHHVAVAAELVARLDPAAGDAWGDATAAQHLPAAG